MERESVNSLSLASVGYDLGSETLEIEFKNGGIYHYYNVPAFMHERLMAADSRGKFFNAEIKEAYSCAKV